MARLHQIGCLPSRSVGAGNPTREGAPVPPVKRATGGPPSVVHGFGRRVDEFEVVFSPRQSSLSGGGVQVEEMACTEPKR